MKAFAVVCLLVLAGATAWWWRRMRARRRWSWGDFPARRVVEETVALADGLPGRLERLGDPAVVVAALTDGRFPRRRVEDLDEDLALLAALADDAARRAAQAERPAAFLRRVTGRPLPGEQLLRDAARRRVVEADDALTRLERVVARLHDRLALLDGGQEEVRALLERARRETARILEQALVPVDRVSYWVTSVQESTAALAEALEQPAPVHAQLVRLLREVQEDVGLLARHVERAERKAVEQKAAEERARREQAARERAEAAAAAARAAAPAVDHAALEAARRAQVAAAEQRFPHHA